MSKSMGNICSGKADDKRINGWLLLSTNNDGKYLINFNAIFLSYFLVPRVAFKINDVEDSILSNDLSGETQSKKKMQQLYWIIPAGFFLSHVLRTFSYLYLPLFINGERMIFSPIRLFLIILLIVTINFSYTVIRLIRIKNKYPKLLDDKITWINIKMVTRINKFSGIKRILISAVTFFSYIVYLLIIVSLLIYFSYVQLNFLGVLVDAYIIVFILGTPFANIGLYKIKYKMLK